MNKRVNEIIKKSKILANDISGRRFTDDTWLTFLDEALAILNREFKFAFKTEVINCNKFPTPTPLPADFLVIKSLYFKDKEAIWVSYDKLFNYSRYNTTNAYYAIEGNKLFTNFEGEAIMVYYSNDIRIEDVPPVFDNLIVDYLVWKFYQCQYPELEENYYNIYERNKFKLKQDILNLETRRS